MQKGEKTHIFFCPSTTAVYQTLEILSMLDENAPIKIIASDDAMYDFLEKNHFKNLGELISMPGLNQSIAGSTLKKHVYARIKNNRLFKEFFTKIQNQNIYFFNHHYWDFGLRIIQKLSKKNQIFFYNLFSLLENTPKDKYAIFKLHWIFGAHALNVVKFETDSLAVISKKFISKNRIKTITPRYEIKKFKNLCENLFGKKLLQYKAIILLDGGFDKHYIDKDKYIDAYIRALECLKKKYHPEEILVKPHPHEYIDIPKLKPFINEPYTFLPAELLIHPNLEIIIGTISTALRFSNPHLNHILRISLIYVCYKDSLEKKIFMDTLKDTSGNIHMPKTFEEFKQLISNHYKTYKTEYDQRSKFNMPSMQKY